MSTAKQMYATKSKEILQQIKTIEAALKTHEKHFKKDDANWGMVGDLNHVKAQLGEIDGFLKTANS